MAEAVSGEKISVGAPYFNAVAGPLAILLGILLAVGPLLSWRQEKRPVLRKLALPALFAATALVIAFLALPQATILCEVRSGACRRTDPGGDPAAHRPQSLAHAARDLGNGHRPFGRRGCGRRHGGRQRLHDGEADGLTPGETVEVGPWLVRFEGVAPVAGPNWTAVEAELRASRGGGVHVLRPQSRFFTDPPTETNEAAIKTVAERPALHGARSGRRGGPLAVALVVEAAGHSDLARRRAGRARRAAGICWPRSSGLAEEGGRHEPRASASCRSSSWSGC